MACACQKRSQKVSERREQQRLARQALREQRTQPAVKQTAPTKASK